jgi:hypothetical protein
MMPLGWLLCVHLERGARGLLEAIAIASLVSLVLLLSRWLMLVAKSRTQPDPSTGGDIDDGGQPVPAHPG